ncbi:hypothetical protein ACFW5U_36110 [Streptomyces rochei]|uniref:hypothetical protein n=1 Tax=Streptomyces TaxID=1883 RepID=UPI000785B135|nr:MULTISPECIES: hypothetical protein [Streptomyces]KYK14255.1 hypothetical protein AUW26_28190 [Streptomyces sp. CC71]WQC12585.1 hypothetical protein TR631_12485 [Streptomyces rochei]
MTTHRYDAEVNVRTKSGDLITVYPDTFGPAGMTPQQIHAAAHKAALAEVRGGTVEGSNVSTTGQKR